MCQENLQRIVDYYQTIKDKKWKWRKFKKAFLFNPALPAVIPVLQSDPVEVCPEIWLKFLDKRENFLLAFFALSKPIWVGDLGTE